MEGHTTYHLLDAKHQMDFGIVPDIGNTGYEFKMRGTDVLVAPDSLKAYSESRSLWCGIPLMSPFTNRIERDSYYFHLKKYLLNVSMGNFLRTPPHNRPIHGLQCYDPRWQVVKTGASAATGAFITARLEFFKYRDSMAQSPFAHGYETTYRATDAKLRCTTKVTNKGKSAMPVHFGYHPYFRPAGPRGDWKLAIAAKTHWIVSEGLIPTRETERSDACLGLGGH